MYFFKDSRESVVEIVYSLPALFKCQSISNYILISVKVHLSFTF